MSIELHRVTRRITMDNMAAYSGAGSSHSDNAVGRQRGYGGAIVQGGQLVAYLNEMMVRSLGPDYIGGGEMSVRFVAPVRPDDVITTHGVETGSRMEDGRRRLEFEIWLENQDGQKCVIGTSSAFLPKTP